VAGQCSYAIRYPILVRCCICSTYSQGKSHCKADKL